MSDFIEFSKRQLTNNSCSPQDTTIQAPCRVDVGRNVAIVGQLKDLLMEELVVEVWSMTWL